MPAEAPGGPVSAVMYRSVGMQDLDQVTGVHRLAFPDSAVTQLGPAVVRRYYRWQFTGPHPVPFAVGAWRDGELVGFVFGGLRYKAVAGFARGSLGTIALGAITHPRAVQSLALPKVASLARLMVYRGRPAAPAPAATPTVSDGPPGEELTGASFGILSIAVLPSAQGSGVAAELMAQARAAAVSHGFSQMNLTVQIDNARAIVFYEKLGWKRCLSGGEWNGAMRLLLDRH